MVDTLLNRGDEPYHFNRKVHRKATMADIHIYDDKVAANIAESAAKRVAAAYSSINTEHYFATKET